MKLGWYLRIQQEHHVSKLALVVFQVRDEFEQAKMGGDYDW